MTAFTFGTLPSPREPSRSSGSRILAKLDCANRVQAALLVRDAGTGR